MGKCFNVTGACDPQLHYMVDIKDRLAEIKELVDDGAHILQLTAPGNMEKQPR